MQCEAARRTGNIFLVGMMGAGKTTVGRRLARRLGRSFLDTDHEIQERTGVSIPTIFEIEGEAGFRRRESAVLAEIARGEDLVVATGGGIVLAEQNRRLLRQRGTVVYLRASVEDLFARTRHDRNRPLLQTEDPRAKLAELFAARDPLYREVADIIMETGRQSVQTLVRQLEKQLHAL
jgi:shikimate kinase